jgi:Abnormal spindle-like microcephaly-assoc'd, ASPM-SPD-2-Hydin/Glycosyl hydrolases family 39
MAQALNFRRKASAGRDFGAALVSFLFSAMSPARTWGPSANPKIANGMRRAGDLLLTAFLAWCALQQTGCVGPAAVALTATPKSLSWASVPVGSAGNAQAVTLTNDGTSAASISNVAISGANASDFSISAKTCGSTLTARSSCTVTVLFVPTAAGARSATLAFTYTGGMSTETVSLSGNGTTAAGVDPSSLSFGTVNVGSSGPSQSTTLQNGGTSISLSSVAVTGTNPGDFTISGNACGSGLAPSASCTVDITFTPTTTGPRTATLTFTDTAGNSPQTVALSGTGGSPAPASSNATVAPASLSFATTAVGSTSPLQSVTLSTGPVAIKVSSIGISGANSADFAISSKSCGATLAASSSCTVSIAFKPSATGGRSATLTFNDSAGNSPQSVALFGTGVTSSASASPTSLSFSATNVGATSTPQLVTLRNGIYSTISISNIAISGPNSADFAITSRTCGATLAASASCTVTIAFTPAATGARTATLTFTDSAGNSPQTIAMTGKVVDFSIQPINPTVVVNQILQFSATTPVTWTASCGILNNPSTGLYTAPSSPQTCTLRATQTSLPYGTASTQVKVIASSSGTYAVYPSTAAVAVGSQQIFQAQLATAPDPHSLSYSIDGVSGGDSTTGTVTNQGVYTAPNVAGPHLLAVLDNTLGTTATSAINVYTNVMVDFGSRAPNANPVPAGMFGAQYLESLHNTADLDLVLAGGITSGRTYAQIVAVFNTSTPNWTPIDNTVRRITAGGAVNIMLEMYQSPAWLQQGTCGVYSMPSDVNAWASIAQQFVHHMDTTFPGIVTDYEIWNEPNIALCVPAGDDALTDYVKLYSAAVPLMKNQAKADGQTIRVGGPVSAGLEPNWITAMLNDPVISQNIDFMSYHSYLVGVPGETALWDTYNGSQSIYQLTQDSLGPANIYEYAGTLVAGGKQPQGKNLPIYITEYNLDWKFAKTCCSNDFTYSPVWNALYVADLLDVPFAYDGAPNSMSRLIYYAANQPPYYCLVGQYNTNMDCTYPQGSVPQRYPQYFAYQLLGAPPPNGLGLQNGAYMATSMSPPRLVNGLVVTAFFTPSLDAIVLINPSQYTYTDMPINVANSGFTSPQATLYQIVNGQSIQSSTLALQSQGGTSYSTTVTMGPYSVQAISLH